MQHVEPLTSPWQDVAVDLMGPFFFISALLNYIEIFQYVGKVVKIIEKMGGGGLGI